MSNHEKINYVEFQSSDIAKTKTFFTSVFGWEYQDYGPDYVAVTNAGIDAGFYKSDKHNETQSGGVLIVFYSEKLEETLAKVKDAGGDIIKDIFSFPGLVDRVPLSLNRQILKSRNPTINKSPLRLRSV